MFKLGAILNVPLYLAIGETFFFLNFLYKSIAILLVTNAPPTSAINASNNNADFFCVSVLLSYYLILFSNFISLSYISCCIKPKLIIFNFIEHSFI